MWKNPLSNTRSTILFEKTTNLSKDALFCLKKLQICLKVHYFVEKIHKKVQYSVEKVHNFVQKNHPVEVSGYRPVANPIYVIFCLHPYLNS